MRKITAIALLSLVAHTATAADWIDNWFANSVRSGPSTFKSQQRGFYSAGSFSGRFDLQSDNPISITLPKITIGCGGIDSFMGGITFLDPEYLLKKMERILQAAPAFAFDIALKTYCKECSETIAKLESVTNALNSIQMDECAMSKRLVTTVARGDPNIVKAMWSEMSANASLDNNTHKNWKEAQEKISNDPEQIPDLKKLTAGCPPSFNEIFKHGSLIANAVSRTGVQLAPFVDLVRGYVGDVMITARDSDKVPLAQPILPCPENQKNTLEDMLHGRSYARLANGQCKLIKNKSVLEATREKLLELAKKMKERKALLPADTKFIESVPHFPVHIALKNAITQKEEETLINNVSDVVATSYTWFIFRDLHRHIEHLFDTVATAVNTPSANGKGQSCDTRAFEPAIGQFEKLHAALKVSQQGLAVAFEQKMKAYLACRKAWSFRSRI